MRMVILIITKLLKKEKMNDTLAKLTKIYYKIKILLKDVENFSIISTKSGGESNPGLKISFSLDMGLKYNLICKYQSSKIM